MKKLRTYDIFVNEGIRDMMTPKSEEDIKNSIGEEKYNIYKSLINAKNSIKPPFKTDQLSMLDMMEKRLTSFQVDIRFLNFTIVCDSRGIWTVHYKLNNNQRALFYKTWKEAWYGVLEISEQVFNREISLLEAEVSRHQENIDELRELVSKVIDNKSINEGVRDKMTPVDPAEINNKVDEYFERARKDEDVGINSTIYYDLWEDVAEKYRLFDYYYVYKGGVYTIHFDDNNDAILSYTYEHTDKFQEKLFKAIEKIDSMK
jgi:hypothetical protein